MSLDAAQFNLTDYVLTAGRRTPDKVALTLADRSSSYTYAQLERAVRGLATGLLASGLKPGDRVLLRLANTPLFPISYLAAIAVGIVPVPTSGQLTQSEVDVMARAVLPAGSITDDGFYVPTSSAINFSASEATTLLRSEPADYVMGDAGRAAYIVFTSGTSGRATPVLHAHRAILARRSMWDGWYGLRPSDVLLHAGAFNWTYTLGTGLMDPWAIGATAVIPPDGTDTSLLPGMLKGHDATLFAAAPGVFRRVLRSKFPALPALRHGLSAGEKLPETLRDAWKNATGTNIHEAYGMSECSTFISGNPDRSAPEGTLGFVQSDRRVTLLEDGQISDHGMIAIHRSDPGLMLGYWNDDEATKARFQGEWFLTGDIGRRDGEAIRYEGRADDMMNAGGTRVSPIEVESAMQSHPDIHEVACAEVRLRDDLTLIAAFYTAEDVINEDELRQHAAKTLAPYKVPRIYIRTAELPRGANNKLLRRVLRTKWETEHGQT